MQVYIVSESPLREYTNKNFDTLWAREKWSGEKWQEISKKEQKEARVPEKNPELLEIYNVSREQLSCRDFS